VGGKGSLQTSAPRPIFEMMVEQVECADLIVLNKRDTVGDEEAARLRAEIGGLNPRAEIIETEHGQVASETLVDRVRFDASGTLGSAEWIQVLNEVAAQADVIPAVPSRTGEKPVATRVRPRHGDRFGIGSFVFQARRPFRRGKFEAFLENGWPGLLRAKGYFWLAEQPDEVGFLSLAGEAFHLNFLSYWWAAMVENGKVRRVDVPAVLEKLWIEPSGDRRQEIVFIGVNLDEAAMRCALEAGLVDG
jgi:G3E family GTPase